MYPLPQCVESHTQIQVRLSETCGLLGFRKCLTPSDGTAMDEFPWPLVMLCHCIAHRAHTLCSGVQFSRNEGALALRSAEHPIKLKPRKQFIRTNPFRSYSAQSEPCDNKSTLQSVQRSIQAVRFALVTSFVLETYRSIAFLQFGMQAPLTCNLVANVPQYKNIKPCAHAFLLTKIRNIFLITGVMIESVGWGQWVHFTQTRNSARIEDQKRRYTDVSVFVYILFPVYILFTLVVVPLASTVY